MTDPTTAAELAKELSLPAVEAALSDEVLAGLPTDLAAAIIWLRGSRRAWRRCAVESEERAKSALDRTPTFQFRVCQSPRGVIVDWTDVVGGYMEFVGGAHAGRPRLEFRTVERAQPDVPDRDLSGWSAAENAEFEELYGVPAAMRLRASNNRVWEIVHELRSTAADAGLDPYQDPMAQRLSAALVQPEPEDPSDV